MKLHGMALKTRSVALQRKMKKYQIFQRITVGISGTFERNMKNVDLLRSRTMRTLFESCV